MSFHVRDDFRPGAPISQVPASWFNKVAQFLNNLVGGFGITLMKSENGASVIEVDQTAIRQAQNTAVGTPSDVGSFPTDDGVTQAASTLWTAGGENGAALFVLYKGEADANTGIHDLYAAKLTITADGRIVKIDSVQNGGMEIMA
jgi:hypothetical protein